MATLRTLIVLSTAHLDEATSSMLDDMGEDTHEPRHFTDWRDRVVRCGFGYGHWVKVPRPDPEDPGDGLECRMAGFPESLVECMRHAAAFGAAWILFDCDEPEVDSLKTYEWED